MGQKNLNEGESLRVWHLHDHQAKRTNWNTDTPSNLQYTTSQNSQQAKLWIKKKPFHLSWVFKGNRLKSFPFFRGTELATLSAYSLTPLQRQAYPGRGFTEMALQCHPVVPKGTGLPEIDNQHVSGVKCEHHSLCSEAPPLRQNRSHHLRDVDTENRVHFNCLCHSLAWTLSLNKFRGLQQTCLYECSMHIKEITKLSLYRCGVQHHLG